MKNIVLSCLLTLCFGTAFAGEMRELSAVDLRDIYEPLEERMSLIRQKRFPYSDRGVVGQRARHMDIGGVNVYQHNMPGNAPVLKAMEVQGRQEVMIRATPGQSGNLSATLTAQTMRLTERLARAIEYAAPELRKDGMVVMAKAPNGGAIYIEVPANVTRPQLEKIANAVIQRMNITAIAVYDVNLGFKSTVNISQAEFTKKTMESARALVHFNEAARMNPQSATFAIKEAGRIDNISRKLGFLGKGIAGASLGLLLHEAANAMNDNRPCDLSAQQCGASSANGVAGVIATE
jgi:hypothetical protein